MKYYYCWRCCKDMPFLDESEWLMIEPHLAQGILDIKNYREQVCTDLNTARQSVRSEAMTLFADMTGMDYVHADIINHHRLSDWGDECINCAQLLRTSKATICGHCGYEKGIKP